MANYREIVYHSVNSWPTTQEILHKMISLRAGQILDKFFNYYETNNFTAASRRILPLLHILGQINAGY